MCKPEKKLSKKEFEKWFENHKAKLTARVLQTKWRVEEQNNFFYTLRTNNLQIFVGDKESCFFRAVKKTCYSKYGDSYSIIKEQCTKFVQQIMGTRLREYKKNIRGAKLREGLTVGTKNRLTEKDIAKIQNYYEQAILGNTSDKKGMKNNTGQYLKTVSEMS